MYINDLEDFTCELWGNKVIELVGDFIGLDFVDIDFAEEVFEHFLHVIFALFSVERALRTFDFLLHSKAFTSHEGFWTFLRAIGYNILTCVSVAILYPFFSLVNTELQ